MGVSYFKGLMVGAAAMIREPRRATQGSFPLESAGNVTKVLPLKLIARSKLTFDERTVVYRVEPQRDARSRWSCLRVSVSPRCTPPPLSYHHPSSFPASPPHFPSLPPPSPKSEHVLRAGYRNQIVGSERILHTTPSPR